jgi:RNA polymerase sigma-70 factor (ECF subfamily)
MPGASEGAEELLRRIAQRDQGAMVRLYDAFAPRMLGLISMVVKDRNAAQDVLQDVMINVWQTAAARFNPALGSAESWLLMVARSRAIDHARRTTRQARIGASGQEEAIERSTAVAPGFAPERAAGGASGEGASRLSALRSGLDGLTPEEREPVMLAYAQGMSREQIAAHLGVPVGTVKTRIHRAIGRLRESLRAGA